LSDPSRIANKDKILLSMSIKNNAFFAFCLAN